MESPSPSESMPFQTSDFYLACFLHARGYTIKEVIRSNMSKRVTFSFDQRCTDESALTPAKDLVLGFYNGVELVSAFRFCSALRELRGLLYNTEEAL